MIKTRYHELKEDIKLDYIDPTIMKIMEPLLGVFVYLLRELHEILHSSGARKDKGLNELIEMVRKL